MIITVAIYPVKAVEPTPDTAPFMALSTTDSAAIKRASAAAGLVLEIPAQVLFDIAEVPPAPKACSGPALWWLPIAIQVFGTMAYLYLGKPKTLATGLTWLTVLAVGSYFMYTAIGCGCGTLKICSYYFVFNLGLITAGGIYVYFLTGGKIPWKPLKS